LRTKILNLHFGTEKLLVELRYEKAALKMFVKLTSRFQWIILLPRKEDSHFKFQGEPDFTWIEKALQHTSKDFKIVDAKTNLMNT
jgi:hypothetical protein